MWWHIPLIPALQRQRQTYLCEIKGNIVYIVSPRSSRATQEDRHTYAVIICSIKQNQRVIKSSHVNDFIHHFIGLKVLLHRLFHVSAKNLDKQKKLMFFPLTSQELAPTVDGSVQDPTNRTKYNFSLFKDPSICLIVLFIKFTITMQ